MAERRAASPAGNYALTGRKLSLTGRTCHNGRLSAFTYVESGY
ncbi:hypothetical protein [Acinetobacter baumannii]|nr:hypothetical protein [Acinetobacter baumannii]